MAKDTNIASLLPALFVLLFAIGLDRLNCKAAVVISSSSEYGSSCNGLQCPPNTNCMAFSKSMNGNTTQDKRCTAYDGRVVRQETTTIANGRICIKNLTMIHDNVNVDYNCRELNKQEKNAYYTGQNDEKFSAALDDYLEQEQDVLEAAMGREQGNLEKMQAKLKQDNEKRKEYLERLADYREKMIDMRKEHLEKEHEEKQEAWERYMETMEERMEAAAQQREKHMEQLHAARSIQMEKRKDLLERKAELLEEQRERAEEQRELAAELKKERIERALEAIDIMAHSKDFRRPRW